VDLPKFDGMDPDRSIIITEVLFFELHNTFEEVMLKITKHSMEGAKALLFYASLSLLWSNGFCALESLSQTHC
jgi:hypothetical protein